MLDDFIRAVIDKHYNKCVYFKGELIHINIIDFYWTTELSNYIIATGQHLPACVQRVIDQCTVQLAPFKLSDIYHLDCIHNPLRYSNCCCIRPSRDVA